MGRAIGITTLEYSATDWRPGKRTLGVILPLDIIHSSHFSANSGKFQPLAHFSRFTVIT